MRGDIPAKFPTSETTVKQRRGAARATACYGLRTWCDTESFFELLAMLGLDLEEAWG